MKKLLTLTLMTLLTAMGADAQNFRRWDFTNWSAQTVAALTAASTEGGQLGGSWSDIEKKDAGATTPGGGVCFWSYGDNVVDGNLAVGEYVIPETEGLVFNTGYTTRRSLALAVNYSSTSLGEYAGAQYLWLGGGNAKSAGARIACFTIPRVHVGQKITFTVESHKPSESRGVALFIGDCTNDSYLIGEQFKPTTLDSYTWEEWTLPEGAPTNEDGTVDVVVYNTNGCHIYSIEVGDSDEKSKVAYLYGGDISTDLVFGPLCDSEQYTVEPIEANKAFQLSDLTDYDAIVISSTVTDANATASLKAIRPFIPTLNLNPALYAGWGMGTAQAAEAQFANVKMPNHALFHDLELIASDEEGVQGLLITQADSYQAVTLTGDFADDAVLATVMGNDDLVAIHGHSLSRNAYIYLPLTQEAMEQNGNGDLLRAAAAFVANTKAKLSQAPAPTITFDYKNGETTVTLKSTVPMAEIYYTLDDSEPTTESTRYAEPFTVTTEGITVKAVAIGEGYLLSDVALQKVVIKTQAATPTINVENGEGQATVTISGDGNLYYNYGGSNDIAKSAAYTEPVTVKKSRTIYAFAAEEGKLNSEVASAEITIEGSVLRTNILSHMDANPTDYNGGSSSQAYYFDWGKNKSGENAYPFYNEDAGYDEETVTDSVSGDDYVVRIYKEMNPEVAIDFNTGWMLRSRGQVADWENLVTGTAYGDNSGYNYASIEDENPDFPATRSVIVLADKNTVPDGATFPYNAYLVSTVKFKGPFDIVANIGSIVKPANDATHHVVLQVSADSAAWEANWQTVGDTITIVNKQRLTTNVTRSYNGTDEVYVRAYLCGGNSKAGFYDIYIANNPDEKPIEKKSGDVNGDGSIDVADISCIISVMAGTETDPDKVKAADVNGDGNTDVADISSVITIMAGN